MFLAHHCLTFRWRWWRWDCSWSGWALFAKSGGWLRQHATAVCSYDTGFDRSPNRGTWMVIKKNWAHAASWLLVDFDPEFSWTHLCCCRQFKNEMMPSPFMLDMGGPFETIQNWSKTIWNSNYNLCMFEINIVDSKSTSNIYMHKVKSFCRRFFLLKIQLSPKEFIPWLRQSDAV